MTDARDLVFRPTDLLPTSQNAANCEVAGGCGINLSFVRVGDHSPAILSMSALACSHQLTVRALPPCALPAAFLEPGGASSIPPVTKQNRLQPAVFWLRRCSLAFMI